MGKWLAGFAAFFFDMWRHWVGKMTASLSLILGIAPLAFPDFFSGNGGLFRTRTLWWSASAIAFFVAARHAWGEQRQAAVERAEEIERLTAKIEEQSVPQITGDIDQAILGPDGSGSHTGLIVTLRNTGAASAIPSGSWKLSATVGGMAFDGTPYSIPAEGQTFKVNQNLARRIAFEDALYLKAERPLEHNGTVQGFIYFGFRDLPDSILKSPSTELVLSATSVTGHDIVIRSSVGRLFELARQGKWRLFGGLKYPVLVNTSDEG